MEIAQIEAFLAVIREGSFTKAAERLNLTQPSLSARIYHLERSLGGELFKRDKRPIQLTILGETFIDYAQRVISILEAGYEAARSVRSGSIGRVTVSCPFSLATYLIPQVVSRFSQQYPQAELHIEAGHSDFAITQLLDGVANLALAAAFPRYLPQTQTLLRLHDEMVVAVNPHHPLAELRLIPMNLLWDYQIVLSHWGVAFDAYIESLRQMDGAMGPVLRVPLPAALPIARQSSIITFVPRRLVAISELVELQMPEFQFDWDTLLVTRPGRTLTMLETAFVEIVSIAWQNRP